MKTETINKAINYLALKNIVENRIGKLDKHKANLNKSQKIEAKIEAKGFEILSEIIFFIEKTKADAPSQTADYFHIKDWNATIKNSLRKKFKKIRSHGKTISALELQRQLKKE